MDLLNWADGAVCGLLLACLVGFTTVPPAELEAQHLIGGLYAAQLMTAHLIAPFVRTGFGGGVE